MHAREPKSPPKDKVTVPTPLETEPGSHHQGAPGPGTESGKGSKLLHGREPAQGLDSLPARIPVPVQDLEGASWPEIPNKLCPHIPLMEESPTSRTKQDELRNPLIRETLDAEAHPGMGVANINPPKGVGVRAWTIPWSRGPAW